MDLLNLPSFDRMEKEGHLASIRKVIEKDLPDLLQPIKSASTADPRDKYDAKNLKFIVKKITTLTGKRPLKCKINITTPWRTNWLVNKESKELLVLGKCSLISSFIYLFIYLFIVFFFFVFFFYFKKKKG